MQFARISREQYHKLMFRYLCILVLVHFCTELHFGHVLGGTIRITHFDSHVLNCFCVRKWWYSNACILYIHIDSFQFYQESVISQAKWFHFQSNKTDQQRVWKWIYFVLFTWTTRERVLPASFTSFFTLKSGIFIFILTKFNFYSTRTHKKLQQQTRFEEKNWVSVEWFAERCSSFVFFL